MKMARVLMDMVLIAVTAAVIWGVVIGIRMVLNGTRDSRGVCLVVPLAGHVEDAELLIREAVAAARRAGLRGAVVYVADFGADEETAAIAQRLCEAYGVAEWVAQGELSEKIAALRNH